MSARRVVANPLFKFSIPLISSHSENLCEPTESVSVFIGCARSSSPAAAAPLHSIEEHPGERRSIRPRVVDSEISALKYGACAQIFGEATNNFDSCIWKFFLLFRRFGGPFRTCCMSLSVRATIRLGTSQCDTNLVLISRHFLLAPVPLRMKKAAEPEGKKQSAVDCTWI